MDCFQTWTHNFQIKILKPQLNIQKTVQQQNSSGASNLALTVSILPYNTDTNTNTPNRNADGDGIP